MDAPANKTKAPVVVLLQVPGAVLMPWAHDVDAIATMFLGGQETGAAWASVLFGDYAPTGHLPVSIPKTDGDTISPSSDKTVTYSEGMSTGYRDTSKQYLFPFGHGLTYTSFKYGKPKQHHCGEAQCVTLSIQNVGAKAAATVPQLYLEFPPEAQYPAPVLKGFQKTAVIKPGHTVQVTFQFTEADLSFWDSGSWCKIDTATAHIGASSADIRQTLPLLLAGERVDVFV
jgi:beta-glucosidase